MASSQPRIVYLYFKIKDDVAKNWKDPKEWPAHSSLWVQGNADNQHVLIDLLLEVPRGQPVVRVLELGEHVKQPDISTYRQRVCVGKTTIKNADLLAPGVKNKGTGLVIDAVNQDWKYRVGPKNAGNLNSCHDVLTRIANIPGVSLNPATQKFMDYYNGWTVDESRGGFDITAAIRYVNKAAPKTTFSRDNETKKSYRTQAP